MKIKIQSALWSDIDDFIKNYPQLRYFGFVVEKECKPKTVTVSDDKGESMTYEYDCKCYYTPYIFLSDVAEVFDLMKLIGKDVVFAKDEALITIYDTYLE